MDCLEKQVTDCTNTTITNNPEAQQSSVHVMYFIREVLGWRVALATGNSYIYVKGCWDQKRWRWDIGLTHVRPPVLLRGGNNKHVGNYKEMIRLAGELVTLMESCQHEWPFLPQISWE